MAEQLGVFAKYWQPGTVKTRLAATIGDAGASRLYKQFVKTLLADSTRLPTDVCWSYAPADTREEFVDLAAGRWELTPQADGNLGQRMSAFFHAALASGSQRVVLIGSDSPTLPVLHVREAFSQLESHDVVLGPSDDGGYYLIGAAGQVPAVFDQITWSTPRVWPQTIERLEHAGVRYFVLPPWYDVDDHNDLDRFAPRADRPGSYCGSLA